MTAGNVLVGTYVALIAGSAGFLVWLRGQSGVDVGGAPGPLVHVALYPIAAIVVLAALIVGYRTAAPGARRRTWMPPLLTLTWVVVVAAMVWDIASCMVHSHPAPIGHRDETRVPAMHYENVPLRDVATHLAGSVRPSTRFSVCDGLLARAITLQTDRPWPLNTVLRWLAQQSGGVLSEDGRSLGCPPGRVDKTSLSSFGGP